MTSTVQIGRLSGHYIDRGATEVPSGRPPQAAARAAKTPDEPGLRSTVPDAEDEAEPEPPGRLRKLVNGPQDALGAVYGALCSKSCNKYPFSGACSVLR